MKQVVIVGAGVSGLATAYHVICGAEQRGLALHVTVLESGERPGGRVWTQRIDGFQIELGASSFLDSKRSTLALCEQLGLSNDLLPARSDAAARYICKNHELLPVPLTPGQLIRSRLLSWTGKARLLCERWVRRPSESLDETIHDFACRRIGPQAAEVLVDAMVTGIHAGDPSLLSVAAAFPRMVELERDHGSLFRAMAALRAGRATANQPGGAEHRTFAGPSGTPWSLKRGMGQLIERLAEDHRITLFRGSPVKSISAALDGQWTVHGESATNWQADSVILACPSFDQSVIVQSIDSELAGLLGEISYNSVTVVALGFRRSDVAHSLAGFGYLIPQCTRRDVLGVLWNSTIFDGRAPHGMVLLQAMCGGWNRPDVVKWDDERIVRAVVAELRHTMNVTASPAFVHITRWPQAIPQYHVGHLGRVAAIDARVGRWPGLHLTGNSFRGISVNDCTENAERCADAVLDRLVPDDPRG